MPVQVTSIISYTEVLTRLTKRHKEIISIFRRFNIPMNNKMVLEAMRRYYPRMEISSITGRMYELEGKRKKKDDKNRLYDFEDNKARPKILIKHHTASCPETGRTTDFYILNSHYKDILA